MLRLEERKEASKPKLPVLTLKLEEDYIKEYLILKAQDEDGFVWNVLKFDCKTHKVTKYDSLSTCLGFKLDKNQAVVIE